MPTPDTEATAPPRLHNVPLTDLVGRNDTALRNAIKRVRQQAAQGAHHYAAHSSSPNDKPPAEAAGTPA